MVMAVSETPEIRDSDEPSERGDFPYYDLGPATSEAVTALDLDAIETRHRAATLGPWRADSHSHIQSGCRCLSCYDDPTVYQLSVFLDCEDVPRWDDDATRCQQSGFQSWEDADFAAHAREDVPALVADVRSLRAKVAAVEARVVEWEALRDRLRAQNPVRKTGSSGLHRREANTLDVVAEQIRAALATGEGK